MYTLKLHAEKESYRTISELSYYKDFTYFNSDVLVTVLKTVLVAFLVSQSVEHTFAVYDHTFVIRKI